MGLLFPDMGDLEQMLADVRMAAEEYDGDGLMLKLEMMGFRIGQVWEAEVEGLRYRLMCSEGSGLKEEVGHLLSINRKFDLFFSFLPQQDDPDGFLGELGSAILTRAKLDAQFCLTMDASDPLDVLRALDNFDEAMRADQMLIWTQDDRGEREPVTNVLFYGAVLPSGSRVPVARNSWTTSIFAERRPGIPAQSFHLTRSAIGAMTPTSGVVIDPFDEDGTTLMAAIEARRSCFVMVHDIRRAASVLARAEAHGLVFYLAYTEEELRAKKERAAER